MTSINRTVEILEGNETIRHLMADVLSGIGLSVRSYDEHSELPDELADLLIVDVDSGIPEPDDRARRYRENARRVIVCGLRTSRERYADEVWVDRPFSPSTLLHECLAALEISPEALDVDKDTEPVGNLDDEEPITRELQYDEAEALEAKLGLEPGVLGTPKTQELPEDSEAFEVIDVDGPEHDMVIEVEELNLPRGGALVGEVDRRRIESREIEVERSRDIRVQESVRNPAFNQTMPETPTALGSDTSDGSAPEEEDTPDSIPVSDIGAQIKGVARMLAESWQRIALTARTEDRADRIERVLLAAVTRGMRGASGEVQRIPATSGFAGSLDALPLIDLLRTIRDRRLRGRLELAIGAEAYVMYLDTLFLEDIDALSGSFDEMLLDILRASGALDDRTHEELVQSYAAGELVAPVEMKLSSDGIVRESALQRARTERARALFRRICGTRGGQFAFLEIRPGDGQPWPVDPLQINLDQLLLEILREASIDTGDSRATARTRLVLDPSRAASVDPRQLTPEEREVLLMFKEGETLGEARLRLERAGHHDVDQIVDRLKKLELLKRTDPTIEVPEQVERAHRDDTVVSDLTVLPNEEEADDFQDAQTTALKQSFEVAPLSDNLADEEVDALVDEAIAQYEKELSETSETED